MHILDSEPPEPGSQHRQQCTHRHRRGKRRGQRCRSSSGYDYRYCDHHLDVVHGLRVGNSRLGRNAGLGLFATAPFRHGQTIGVFAGEIIDNAEYMRRYAATSGFARYVVGLGPSHSHDESIYRTALSYANDGVNLRDVMMRRNYVYRDGSHVVWHDRDWPHVINCVCDSTPDGSRACLVSVGDIGVGDELYWSYSGSHLPSKDASGNWVTVSATSQEPVDAYWYGETAFQVKQVSAS